MPSDDFGQRGVQISNNMVDANVQNIGWERMHMPAKTPQGRKENNVHTGHARTSTKSVDADFIAIALKKLHHEVESEAVPKEFMDLLADIDRKIGSSGDSH